MREIMFVKSWKKVCWLRKERERERERERFNLKN
jgi:hypothetical protein